MRKKKKSTARKSFLGRLILFVFAFVSIGLLFSQSYNLDFKNIISVSQEVESKISDLKESISIADNGSSQSNSIKQGKDLKDRLEYVIVPSNTREEIIEHTGYTVSHNSKWKIPNWVGYELTRRELMGTNKRNDNFAPDPLVKGNKAQLSDYKNSGYDRGHMAPAADMKWSKKVMEESFYLSNICPQNQNLNRGDWNDLEEKVRSWAKRDSAIIIVCGPIVSKRPQKIGNNVAVPEAFFKVILSPFKKNPQAIGFIMPNKAGNNSLSHYACSIDKVEEITKMDFFSAMPDDIENKIESTYSLKYWNIR